MNREGLRGQEKQDVNSDNKKEIERLLGAEMAVVYEFLVSGIDSLRRQLAGGDMDEKRQRELIAQLSNWEIYRRGLADLCPDKEV